MRIVCSFSLVVRLMVLSFVAGALIAAALLD